MGEGGLVDRPAAADVDQMAARAQRLQHLGVDDVLVRGVRAQADHQVVGPGGERHDVGEIGEVDVAALAAVAVADLEVEALGALGQFHADGAQPQDSELAPGHAGDGAEAVGDALGPVAAADHLVGPHDAPRRGQQDAEGHLGHVRGVGVGAVRDHDVALAGGGEVDALVAGAVAAEQREAGQRFHQRLGQAHAAGADDGLHMLCGLARHQGRFGPVHVTGDLAALGERRQGGLGEVETGEDGGTLGHGLGYHAAAVTVNEALPRGEKPSWQRTARCAWCSATTTDPCLQPTKKSAP